MTLDQFISRVKDFDNLPAGKKIDYFVYYYTVMEGKEGVTSRDIDECFSNLKIDKYSNISSYLSVNAKKIKSKVPKFIVKKGLYHLERTTKIEIDTLVNVIPAIVASDDYFPLDLFNNTRGYLISIAHQSAACYDRGLYDACSVMTRKLLEVLIIEAFERYQISDRIKNNTGNFYYLSDLIDLFKGEAKWNIGRNAKASLLSLKKMGDLSAHNRRYSAKKPDVDKLKDDLRIVLEELIHLIDYPNWK